MIEAFGAFVVITAVVFGPLAWRLSWERREDRALRVRAVIHNAIIRAYRGESLLSVWVTPTTLWHPGRVLLSAPTGWEWLVEGVYARVARLTPPDYELIVKPARPETPVEGLAA